MNLRASDTLITGRGYGTETIAPMINIAYGGQHGGVTNHGGFISNKPYTRRPAIAKVITYPKLFDKLPNAPFWRQGIKSMFEEHALTLNGINFALSADVDSVAFGGTGEQQAVVTKTRRQQVRLSAELPEKVGRPIHTINNAWLRLLHLDPETNYAGIIGLLGDQEIPDLLPDQNTASILIFEPNETFTHVQKAVLLHNVFPTSDGINEMNKDMTSPNQMENHSVDFESIAQHGYGVHQFAQRYLSDINRSGLSPFYRQAFLDDIDANLEAAAQGYTEGVDQSSRNLART